MRMIIFLLCLSSVAFAAPTAPPAGADEKLKRQMSFNNNQLVEGEIYRPDYSVVTGESPGEGWGVLRLRTSFRDHKATDEQASVAKEIKR